MKKTTLSRFSTAVFLTGLLAASPPARGQPGARDDEWPRYGHDARLTGRTALKGDLETPRAAWSLPLAGTQAELELRPADGRRSLRLGAGNPAAPSARSAVPAGPPLLDLDGSGKPAPAAESHHSRWADILPESRGLERIAWDQTWTTEKICHLELFAHDRGAGQPRRVWQAEAEDTVFNPLDIVEDIDHDGVPEICVALHYRVIIYDGATGRKETELRFHSSRSYGWFGIEDVDGDGEVEFIILSDFQSHLDVLDYDPRKPEKDRLSVKWRREIETAIEQREKWPQIGPRPLADIDGDRKPEIILNMYNDSGAEEWHLVVLDASTGKTRFDMPRRFLQGSADLDGDSAAELFSAEAEGPLVLKRGRIEVLSFRDGTSRTVWSANQAAFAVADLPALGRRWSTTAAEGMKHVLFSSNGNGPFFMALRDAPGGGASTLAAWQRDGKDGWKSPWSLAGLPGWTVADGLPLSIEGPGAAALIRLSIPAGGELALEAEGVEPVLVARSPLGVAPGQPIAARLSPGGRMSIIAEAPAGEIAAIRPPLPGKDAAPQIIWRARGRGMADGSRTAGLLAADLDGDGGSEVLTADSEPSGAAALAALRADGSALWRHVFSRTPGGPPVWNVAALTFWWPGRFRDSSRIDIFAGTRRGPMHSDIGNLLDGRNGATVWSRAKASAPGEFSWGYAGNMVAVADLAGEARDGRDEIANLYPVCFWIADGATGELVAARELASRKALPAWAAYGEPVLFDVDGDGRPEVLLDSPYILALLDRAGKPIWHGKAKRDYPSGQESDNAGETTDVRHALLDLDGDGKLEIASAGYRDGVRAIDAASGAILWSLQSPRPTGKKCAAADIDGKPGDELLYVAGNEIVAVTGDRKGGHILWKWQGPSPLSLPAIADVDGDGKAEIILQSADGSIHCLDGVER